MATICVGGEAISLGGIVPLSADYHRRQADTLIRLAGSTRDQETARALMKLAAEYIMLAEQPAKPPNR